MSAFAFGDTNERFRRFIDGPLAFDPDEVRRVIGPSRRGNHGDVQQFPVMSVTRTVPITKPDKVILNK